MDYTKVNLVSITQPLIDGVNNAEELIAYIARVSNPANQLNTETAPKLLKYLIDNKHWSPFEQVSATVEIITTRDIGRQILRHRSFCFQEFSQRYADPTKSLGFINRECRLQDNKNRQNSNISNDEFLNDEWKRRQENLIYNVKETYNWAIDNGIAKEQARSVLPEGLTLSKMYMTGNIRNFIHFIQVRKSVKVGAQKEVTEVANQIKNVLEEHFPVVFSIV